MALKTWPLLAVFEHFFEKKCEISKKCTFCIKSLKHCKQRSCFEMLLEIWPLHAEFAQLLAFCPQGPVLIRNFGSETRELPILEIPTGIPVRE